MPLFLGNMARALVLLGALIVEQSQAAPPANNAPEADAPKVWELVSPKCVGCVSRCAGAVVGRTFSQPTTRAATMFAFRHLFWDDSKQCAELGEGLGLIFRNLRLWHLGVAYGHFYLECTELCHDKCPYWGRRGRIAKRLQTANRREAPSSAWAYNIQPSYAWEKQYAERKRAEATPQ